MKAISMVLKVSLAVVTVALLPVPVRAFPPAPHHVISGMIRDQYGNPVNDPTAFVVLQTPGGVRLANNLQPGLAPGVNYHLEVPMDAGNTIDIYEANALRTAASFKMYVVLGGVTNTPIQMLTGYSQLGKPGGQTRMDLFLGTDSNGDGLPDDPDADVSGLDGLWQGSPAAVEARTSKSGAACVATPVSSLVPSATAVWVWRAPAGRHTGIAVEEAIEER